MTTVDAVLAYWLDELGPAGWYDGSDAIDTAIRDRFLTAWEDAHAGAYGLWLTYPNGALAYILLTDQFPRNMFRGQARSFATDRQALAAAKSAINHGWDMRIDEPARQFFYLPLMHSENLADQDRAVRLIHDRLPATGASNLLHARAHREVIRQFGRFPYRNAALARPFTAVEQAYVTSGGYGQTVKAMQAGQTLQAG